MLKNIIKIFGISAIFCCLVLNNNASASDENSSASGSSSGFKAKISGEFPFKNIKNESIIFKKGSNEVIKFSELKKLKDERGAFNAALNYQIDNFDFGVELGYRFLKLEDKNNKNNKFENTFYSVMANANYTIKTNIGINSYIGLGVGIAHLDAKAKLKNDSIEFSKNNLAGSLRAGFSYDISDSISTSVGYKAFAMKKIESKDMKDLKDVKGFDNFSGDFKTLNHNIEFGIGFKF